MTTTEDPSTKALTSESTDNGGQRKKRSFDESIGGTSTASGGSNENTNTSSSKDDDVQEVASTASSGGGGKDGRNRDEKRMEINRIRAKEIRKRKKKMEEDMQKQIIQLTLENNKLRTQLKMQAAEISVLRNNQLGTQKQQQFIHPDSYQQQLSLLRSQQGLLPNGLLLGGGMMGHQNSLSAMGGMPTASLAALNSLGSLPMGVQQIGGAGAAGQSQLFTSGMIGGTPGAPASAAAASQDPSSSLLASLAASGLVSGLGGSSSPPSTSASAANDVSSLLFSTASAGSFQNQLPIGDTTSTSGIGGSGEDVNERNLADLLANSTSNVKHSLLEKLQNEENQARHNEFLLGATDDS